MGWRVLVLVLSACGSGVPEEASSDICADGHGLTWENYGESFFARNCSGCHSSELAEGRRNGAPVGVDLDTLGGVQAHWDDILPFVEEGHPFETTDGAIDDVENLEEYLLCSTDVP